MSAKSTAGDFWRTVRRHPGSCWVWLAAKDKAGYGQKRWHGKTVRAHRIAWMLTYGAWPVGLLCHKCDNPSCVRPDHLFCGTDADNQQDAARKDRKSYKLSASDVLKIRAMVSNGTKQTTVASIFGVWPSMVSRVVNGLRRQHVT